MPLQAAIAQNTYATVKNYHEDIQSKKPSFVLYCLLYTVFRPSQSQPNNKQAYTTTSKPQYTSAKPRQQQPQHKPGADSLVPVNSSLNRLIKAMCHHVI